MRPRCPLALLVVLLLAGPLAAQTTAPPTPDLHDHRGFWIGFDFGPGDLQVDCSADCGLASPVPETWNGGAGMGWSLALGGTPRRNLLLGGEIGTTFRPQNTNNAALGWLMFVMRIYPSPRRGFFVHPGLGLGTAALSAPSLGFTGASAITSTGAAIQLGAGYDIRFGGRFALTPTARYVSTFSDGDELTRSGHTYHGPKNPRALVAGFGFNWY